ncbi:MAG: biotin/lipoyl-binding protein [Gammaproteobacteria bacterium]|nr:biotin/lipoyl-binding protein [Gammaproteobacteria bacterium]
MILLSRMRDALARLLPNASSTKHWLAALGILGGSLLISVSIFATGPSAAPEARTEKAWPVSVESITPGALAPMFSAFGRIESAQVARIQTDVIAPIRHVAVREGDWVAAGDVLIELDTAELELQVTQRSADLEQQRANLLSIEGEYALAKQTTDHYRHVYDVSQKKLTRHQDLLEKRMIAQSLLDEAVQQAAASSIEYQTHLRQLADFPNRIAQARAGVKRATALLESARIDLDHGTVRAPFAGPVIAVLVSPGNHTALGVALIEVADAASFEIRTQVPDAYRDSLRRHLAQGHPITARWGDVSVRLTRFAANVRVGQSGLDAFFAIDADALPMAQTGRVVSLKVQLPEEPGVVALPPQAIFENDRIYAVEADRLHAIVVERIGDHTTASGEYRVLVRSPELNPGQRIMTTALPKAISGLLVQPTT